MGRWFPSSTAGRRSKWAALAASAWIQCTAGASYCFGVYSPLLKASQGYDQSTLDSVAFFKDVGANVGVLSGILSSAFPARPWTVLAAGAVQCLAGYLLMWLSVAGVLPRPPPLLMCVYMLLAAHAQTFFNTADVVTAVENFPDSRGTVIGIMKGFLGLSGAILIQIYGALFNGNPSSFLLMLALLPTLLTFLLMFFVEVHKTDEGCDKKFLDVFSLIALTIAGYLMLVIIGECVMIVGSEARILIFLMLLLLLISPLVIVVKAQTKESKILAEASCHDRIRLIDDINSLEVIEERRYSQLAAERSCMKHDHVGPNEMLCDNGHERNSEETFLLPRGENLNLLQAMWTYDFWLLFLAMACGMGSGLATVNNISQIGGSLGYTSMETSTLVSLWSIWNFLGRFGTGYISDYFLRLRGCARPLFIAVTLAIMSIGHAIISSGFPGSLHVGSVLVGVCYGSQWALMPSITSEIFGLRHFGTIFNTVAIASPFGSYILSVRVVGYIYDMESSSSSTDVQKCMGEDGWLKKGFLFSIMEIIEGLCGHS
ncbi:protein NUCLEAR FUSION DEFECTIVE 4-like isoform X2 [Elaeis guineensis]|uniref:Protein NUCLEAR FUSION DEFECTIVE 4 isoform X2 n=1 Tax=Elaeis guineensis var. tenera TaxID=51953 RepID=A0A6I9RX74_ELAGV|nr:protein NUCLEAR FUSION DEFECTIVE 4 isoform X2 [Elaeis guineensis]